MKKKIELDARMATVFIRNWRLVISIGFYLKFSDFIGEFGINGELRWERWRSLLLYLAFFLFFHRQQMQYGLENELFKPN